jgi:hypothetical protein
MKKAVYSILMVATFAAALVACKPNDGGGGGGNDGGGQVATTPAQTCNIPGNTGCNPSVYQQYDSQFVNYTWGNTGSFCGCPAGYRPVMNVSWGISCAPSGFFGASYFQYQSYQYIDIQYPAQNGQYNSIPQVPYSPAVTGYNGNCYTNAVSACDVRTNSTTTGMSTQCGNSGTCRAAGGGTYMGFCSNSVGQDVYSPYTSTNNCYRRTGPYGTWINICSSGYGGGYGGYYGGSYGGYNTNTGGGIPR